MLYTGAIVLCGDLVRLEPLDLAHVPALADAAAQDRSLYVWSFVPQGEPEMTRYVEHALALRSAGRALPFVMVRRADGAAVGSTRFFDLERWNWPADHPRAALQTPDAGEIGYTWLGASAIRTGINRFHTDARNERSAKALEGIGAQFEGVLRSHRLATDFRARNSKRYSIVAEDYAQSQNAASAAAAAHSPAEISIATEKPRA